MYSPVTWFQAVESASRVAFEDVRSYIGVNYYCLPSFVTTSWLLKQYRTAVVDREGVIQEKY
jgi:hypothetical protein